MTLGAVETDLIDHLVAHFQEAYSLAIKLGPGLSVPEQLTRSARLSPDFDEPQIDTKVLAQYLSDSMSAANFPIQAISGLTVIAVTPLDVYISSITNWGWAFGANYAYRVPAGEAGGSSGIVSYHRMDNRTWELPYDNDAFASRVRKMVSKYVGLSHYELALSPDPRSVMYNAILGLDDLDRMGERLPIQP